MDSKISWQWRPGFLQYMVDLLKKDYEKELKILGVTLPNVDKIPTVRFDEAKRKVAEKYGRKIRNPYDLEPGRGGFDRTVF